MSGMAGIPRLFWDPSNHRSLCRACHQAKSAEEERHARLGFELDVDEDGFPLDENWGISRSRSAGKASFIQRKSDTRARTLRYRHEAANHNRRVRP